MPHSFIAAEGPYTEDEHKWLDGYKAGCGPAEDIPEVIGALRLHRKLRESTHFTHEVLDDEHKAPREFWHVKATLGGVHGSTCTDWLRYGKLGDHAAPLPDDVRKKAEDEVFELLRADVLIALGLGDFL